MLWNWLKEKVTLLLAIAFPVAPLPPAYLPTPGASRSSLVRTGMPDDRLHQRYAR